jgi:hypothetical protein
MIVRAAIEHDLPLPTSQHTPVLSNKCDEMGFVIALQMRQIAAIEGQESIVL